MTQALRLALRYSKVDETVLIQGETGVGKEMFAQGIHRASPPAGHAICGCQLRLPPRKHSGK